MTFAEKLRFLRRQKGVTQQEVSEAVGISKRTIIGWEVQGRRPKDRDMIIKLAKYYDVEVNYLLVENEPVDSSGRAQIQARAALEDAKSHFAGDVLSPQEKLQFLQDIQTIFVDSFRSGIENS